MVRSPAFGIPIYGAFNVVTYFVGGSYCSGLSLFASHADAAIITYTVDGDFNGSGIVTGNFTADTATDTVTALNLTSIGGSIPNQSFTLATGYTPALHSYQVTGTSFFVNVFDAENSISSGSGYLQFVFQPEGGDLLQGVEITGGQLSSIASRAPDFAPGYTLDGTIAAQEASVSAVPLPASLPMLMAAVLVLAGFSVRKSRRDDAV